MSDAQQQNSKGFIITTKDNEEIYCKSFRSEGNSIILEEAVIKEVFCLENNDKEITLVYNDKPSDGFFKIFATSSPCYDIDVEYFKPVEGLIELTPDKRIKSIKTFTFFKTLPDWLLYTKSQAEEVAHQILKKQREERAEELDKVKNLIINKFINCQTKYNHLIDFYNKDYTDYSDWYFHYSEKHPFSYSDAQRKGLLDAFDRIIKNPDETFVIRCKKQVQAAEDISFRKRLVYHTKYYLTHWW